MTGSTKWQMVVAVAMVAAQLGCGADSTTDPGLDTPNIEALSPTFIVGTVGGLSPVAPTIRVTGSRTGRPQANVRVRFFLQPATGGSLGTYDALTDSAGVASAGEWQFGPRPGSYQLYVVAGSYQLIFSASLEPDVPDSVRPVTAQDQAGIAGQTVAGPTLQVVDRFLNGIPDLEVKFSIVAGGGTLGAEKATTDQYGIAYVKGWLLGPTPGTNQATATVSGFEPVEFRAEGLDSAALKWYKLEAVKNGSTEIKLETIGIVDARIALTPFDECLCRQQRGYLLRRPPNESGVYVLIGAELYTTQNGIKGSIDADRLVLQAPDPWDGEYTLTWIYRAINESGQ
jgi:hypothetical protein